ncbi:gas vesicle protein GvpM [Halocatena pleomorpha]|uniref:Gas vesicle protein n=1 Tax=Halocatena pleomorpha TaxID=1785090 RepID=A0A3P3R7Y4_9EURY|nr:gas vesicle protein [Halocatena pleomorpha]RRJ29547.1 gas vesicle protein [Halocatena pleomorpha]
MRPTKRDDDAVVDLLDVILRDGAVLEADAIITVADIPLVGLKLRAALAGMTTMTEYGIFEGWDWQYRRRARDEFTGEDQP